MIEPIAWRYKNINQKVWCVSQIKPYERAWGIIEPLYTADQLHPLVKMTQAEFDEFCLLYKKLSNSTAMGILNTVIYNESQEFGNLQSLIFKVGEDFKILSLFDKFDIDNPEETIEIVPDMKWFVRSKERDDEGDYAFLSGIETPDDWGYSKRHDGVNEPGACAYAFDTQDEAELWVTPITKVVQLPMEGE